MSADVEALAGVINRRLSWASLHWFSVRTRGGVKAPTVSPEVGPAIAGAVLASNWLARIRTQAAHDALLEAADAIRYTDQEHGTWLRERAQRAGDGE